MRKMPVYKLSFEEWNRRYRVPRFLIQGHHDVDLEITFILQILSKHILNAIIVGRLVHCNIY